MVQFQELTSFRWYAQFSNLERAIIYLFRNKTISPWYFEKTGPKIDFWFLRHRPNELTVSFHKITLLELWPFKDALFNARSPEILEYTLYIASYFRDVYISRILWEHSQSSKISNVEEARFSISIREITFCQQRIEFGCSRNINASKITRYTVRYIEE